MKLVSFATQARVHTGCLRGDAMLDLTSAGLAGDDLELDIEGIGRLRNQVA